MRASALEREAVAPKESIEGPRDAEFIIFANNFRPIYEYVRSLSLFLSFFRFSCFILAMPPRLVNIEDFLEQSATLSHVLLLRDHSRTSYYYFCESYFERNDELHGTKVSSLRVTVTRFEDARGMQGFRALN